MERGASDIDLAHLRHLRVKQTHHETPQHDPVSISPDEIVDVIMPLVRGAVPPGDVLAVVGGETDALLTLTLHHRTREGVLEAYRAGAPNRIRRHVRMLHMQRTGVTQQRRYIFERRPRGEVRNAWRRPAHVMWAGSEGTN